MTDSARRQASGPSWSGRGENKRQLPISPGSRSTAISWQLYAALAHGWSRSGRLHWHCGKINRVVLDHLSRGRPGERLASYQLMYGCGHCFSGRPPYGKVNQVVKGLDRPFLWMPHCVSLSLSTCTQSLGMGRPIYGQLEGSRHPLALLQFLPETLRPVFVPGRLWGPPCLHANFDCYQVWRSKHGGPQHWSLLKIHWHKIFSHFPPGVVVPLLSRIGGIVNVRGDGSRDFDLRTRSVFCTKQSIIKAPVSVQWGWFHFSKWSWSTHLW